MHLSLETPTTWEDMGGGSNWVYIFIWAPGGGRLDQFCQHPKMRETGLKRLIIWGEGFESEFFQFFFFSLIIYNFVIQQHSI